MTSWVTLSRLAWLETGYTGRDPGGHGIHNWNVGERAGWALCTELGIQKFDGEPIGDWHAHCHLSTLPTQWSMAC